MWSYRLIPVLAFATIALVMVGTAGSQDTPQTRIDVTEGVFGHPWGMSKEAFFEKHGLVEENISMSLPGTKASWRKIGDDDYVTYYFQNEAKNPDQQISFSFRHGQLYQVKISASQKLLEPIDMEVFDPYRQVIADKAAKHYTATGDIIIKGIPAGMFKDGKYLEMEISVEVTNKGLEEQIKQAHKADPLAIAEALEAALLPVIVQEPSFTSDEG